MASAGQKRATLISQKLTFLRDQGDQLNRAVGEFVHGIIEAGESWTEGGTNKVQYLELCQMIDRAVDFLWEKCEELAGVSVGVAGNKMSQSPCEQSYVSSQSSCEQSDVTSHSSKAESFTLVKTYMPPATTSNRQLTEPVQPADETQLKQVLARIAVMEEAMSSFRSNAEKVAEQQISEISDTEEQGARLQRLEKQLQTLSTAQDRMEVEIESQAELTEKLVHVPDQLELVKENLDILDARIGRIVEDCSNKHQDIENVTRDLADKVVANTDIVHVMSEGQDQKTTLLKELETRLQTLEADSERNVQKLAETGEANFRMLCEMLNDRLTPLEQLRTSLNQEASTRDENIKKLAQVIQEVAFMSPRLQQLEVKSSRTRCGFTAGTNFSRLAGGATIKPYTSQYCNVGGNFDAASGIFTAPVDGLYVTSVSLYFCNNRKVTVVVKYNKQGQGQHLSTNACESTTEVIGTSACSVGVVDMKAGDTLFSYVHENNSNGTVAVYFSGFLLA